MAQKTMIQAITDALALELEKDENVLIFGEDVGNNGGVFRATEGLQEKFGEDIAEVISVATGTDDVIVHITSSHSCVSARGVKSANSKTTTLSTKGIFEQDDMINRFLTLKNA